MGATRKYQLLAISNTGQAKNITKNPNSDKDLFGTVKAAEAYALEHRDLFPNGRFMCQSVYVLPAEVKEEAKEEK